MGFSSKIALLSLLFLSVALFVSFGNDIHESEKDGQYETKRLSIQGWQEKPILSSRAVLDTLQANMTVFADYSHDGYEPVNLYIGYYNTLEKAKLSHAPQVCFTAQGWIMISNDKIDIQLGGDIKKVNRLVLVKGEEKLLVYYWYQSWQRVYDDLFQMKLSLLWGKIKKQEMSDEGNAFVRISVPVSQGQNVSADILQKYAEALFVELPRLFRREL